MRESRAEDAEVRAEEVGRRLDGGDEWILRGCSVTFGSGSLSAVVGPSGAGKTSLLYCLSGLDAPTEGRALVSGIDIYASSRQKRAEHLRTRVGFVFQQYNLVPYLTVAENVSLPLALAGRRVERTEVLNVLERFGLSSKAATAASALSGGEQQRAALSRVMLLQPGVVFADEPTGALDTANSLTVLQTLRGLADSGANVVMVTHDVDAAAMADRVVFMRDGRVTGVTNGMPADQILDGMRQSTVGTGGTS